MDASDLDNSILTVCSTRWQKLAMIIARVGEMLSRESSAEDHDRIAERVAALVAGGRLEAQGDLTNWRHSEVRLSEA